MSTEDDLRRANQAKQIMGDPLVVEAFEKLESGLTEAWLSAPEGDTEGRERCYRMVWSMRAFKAVFEKILADGIFAAHEQERIRLGTTQE